MARLTAAAAAAALVANLAIADDVTRWYTQIDNDVMVGTDRWYTSGLRIAAVKSAGDGVYKELGFLQEIYTPDVHHVGLDVVDRPYAGRLLMTAARHDFTPGLYRTLELDAGVRGPASRAQQSAEFIHRFVPAPHFTWANQLPNRADVQAIGVQTHELSHGALHYGAIVGTNVTLVHAGIELRTGGAQAIANPALRFAATPPIAPAGASGFSAFAGISARWVLRNTLLAFNSNPFGPPMELNRGVGRAAGGIAWSAPRAAVSLAVVGDTREFKGQASPHGYGILSLRLDF